MVATLRIAVIGMGGIGSTFAYQLARAGHDVTAIARPGSARLQQLQRDGGVTHVDGTHVATHVSDQLDDTTPFDLVVVTTLAHQVDAVLPALHRSPAKSVQFMFNQFDPERLQAAIGAERSSFGMPFVMATVTADGKLDSTINRSQKTLHGDRRWADLFRAAGIPSAFDANMMLWLRCHTPMCIAFESISIAAVRRGGGASWTEATTVARGMRAGFAVIERLGFRLHPSGKRVLAASPTVVAATMLWTVSRIRAFRELLATALTECRTLVDVLVAAAGPSAPEAQVAAILAMKPSAQDPRTSLR